MKWLIDQAEKMPREILTDCLENHLPKVWGATFPDRSAMKYLFNIYNKYLNVTKVPLTNDCSECRGQLLRYWGFLKRYYE